MLECGPGRFGAADPARKIRELAGNLRSRYDMGVEFLVYDKQPRLEHTNRPAGGLYTATDDVESLFRVLNGTGHPFNLALNGSPDYSRHVPLDTAELKCLENLQSSGESNSVKNLVTVADNALLPEIKQRFPNLSVIASCISAAYEPNLEDFRSESGTGYEDPGFFVKYYRQLYTSYDMVVPINQLATPAFFSALGLQGEELNNKTILFINLGCGCPAIRQCTEHYSGGKNTGSLDMPVIPDKYLAKAEDNFTGSMLCGRSFSSQELMYRFCDLKALLESGFYRFKSPARRLEVGRVADFLCRFITLKEPPVAMPEKPVIEGVDPAELKLSYMENYPERVHHILRWFSWPVFDENDWEAYRGRTAYTIKEELHMLAVKADRLNGDK